MQLFPLISRHAVQRYRQRVDPTASPRTAAEHISRIIATATATARPRHWMRVTPMVPGTRYLYSAEYPHVGLVVADGVVVTLHSRSACKSWKVTQDAGRYYGRAARRAGPYRRERRQVYLQEAA